MVARNYSSWAEMTLCGTYGRWRQMPDGAGGKASSPPGGIRAADRLTIGTNKDGRLEVLLVGQDGVVWHIWQIR